MASLVPNDPIVDLGSQSVILDTVLVERTSGKLGNYSFLEPGAPFKKTSTHTAAQATALEGNEFLAQKAANNTEWINRYWGKPPSTQDIANWEVLYEEGSTSFPAFTRRYLEKRDDYSPRTMGSALPGIYRIRVTNAGSGYNAAPTVSFSGGTGSGAIAIAILNNSGGIAKITIKAEGTYTVAPTVVITATDGGTGGAATAIIQPSTCKLTKERVTNNAPEPYSSLYVVVTRTYETLPGYESMRPGFEKETGAKTMLTRQRVAANTPPTDLGTSRVFAGYGTLYVVDSYVQPDEDNASSGGTLVTLYMELPETRYEFGSEKAICPALFEFITGWSIRPTPPFIQAGPFAGVNYTLTAKRTAVTTSHQFLYSVGPSGALLPPLWQVITPGAASRFFPISGDTIHNAILVYETAPDSSTQLVEDIPASSPSSYSAGDIMVLHASEKPWTYSVFWEKKITYGVEIPI